MIFCRIYGLVLERSDASFQQCTMPHDTTAENCNTRSNTAETAEISSHWKSAEIADFPSRWKFGPYEQKNGGGIVVIPPPHFILSASFFVGLSAWRWACALPRCGSRDSRISQRIPKIRTRPQSETDSDFVGLVPVVGLEPTRCRHQRILSPSRLPIPSHRQKHIYYT